MLPILFLILIQSRTLAGIGNTEYFDFRIDFREYSSGISGIGIS